ncbi:MAG TPA: MBL fold metallo-hydrolase [Actinomycetota bacterium]|nr:MBL fold metallo-hydrolase [Actinomycetota bacterium]
MDHRRREPAPDVFRLVLPLPWPGLDRVNAYLLRAAEGSTLVDCGMYLPDDPRGAWPEVEAALAACDVEPADVTRLVVTHTHIDHYGMAGRFVEQTGCELWMHRSSEHELEIYSDPAHHIDHLRKLFADHGVSDADLDELTGFEDWRRFVSGMVEPTVAVDGGETFTVGERTWEVVHTPGHAASHICLWSASDRLLVSGDHLLPTITPHIDFERWGDEDPLGDFLASLRRVEALHPSLVLPGHGGPFTEGAERARVVARHHDRRLGSILQVVRHEPHTADEITDEIFGSTLLNFQRRLALGEALAHVAYLSKRGEIERVTGDDGVFRYVKTSRRRGHEVDEQE